jgi:ABC-type methionine transport system ATPase subunit
MSNSKEVRTKYWSWKRLSDTSFGIRKGPIYSIIGYSAVGTAELVIRTYRGDRT